MLLLLRLLLPLAIIIDAPWAVRPSVEAISAVLGIAVISTAAAYLLYFHLLAAVGATNVLLVTFLIPVSALLLGVGLLDEVIKIAEYAGMGCIFLGLIIIDGRALGWLLKSQPTAMDGDYISTNGCQQERGSCES